MPTSSLTVCVNGFHWPNRYEICVKSHSKIKWSTKLVFGVYIPWYGQIDGRMVCKHTRETIVFNTYGTQRQPANRQMNSSQAMYTLPADINSPAEEYEAGNKQDVHRLLIVAASHYPERIIREFLWNACRVVGSLYCRHGDNAHAGLCHRSRA